MLKVETLSFSYGNVAAVKNANLSAAAGRVTCVLGRNGAGKTTLLRNIHGLATQSAGTIHLADKNLTGLRTDKRVRAGLAYVSQGRMSDFRRLTVHDTLLVALEGRADGRRTVPEEIYHHFPRLKDLAHRPTAYLSGGEHKQLAIARALVGAPRVLLLDEPTEGVEQKTLTAIGELLRVLVAQKNGATPALAVVLVEQNLHFLRDVGDSFYWMERGEIGAERPIQDLTEDFVRSSQAL